MLRPPALSLLAALALLAAPAAQAAEGVVRKLQPAQAKVTLAHGEIKELGMPAMTMAYRARPPSLLDGLAVGDRVEFTAEKVDGQYVVTAIRKKR
ncbi:MAG: copper-binding protein [Burkholderiales bacterium]|nr:copper-binding protein [Burkholderiales bacterium]